MVIIALFVQMRQIAIIGEEKKSSGGQIIQEPKTRHFFSITRAKTTLRQSEAWTEKQVAKTLAKVYIAKYQAYDVQKAEDYIQSLLKEGLSRLTDNDEKDIEQYIREQNSPQLWGKKRRLRISRL